MVTIDVGLRIYIGKQENYNLEITSPVNLYYISILFGDLRVILRGCVDTAWIG